MPPPPPLSSSSFPFYSSSYSSSTAVVDDIVNNAADDDALRMVELVLVYQNSQRLFAPKRALRYLKTLNDMDDCFAGMPLPINHTDITIGGMLAIFKYVELCIAAADKAAENERNGITPGSILRVPPSDPSSAPLFISMSEMDRVFLQELRQGVFSVDDTSIESVEAREREVRAAIQARKEASSSSSSPPPTVYLANVDITHEIVSLIIYADFLDCQELIRACCQYIANHMHNKSPRQIREYYGLTDDRTPEEREEFERGMSAFLERPLNDEDDGERGEFERDMSAFLERPLDVTLEPKKRG
jgi:hypothetical protein